MTKRESKEMPAQKKSGTINYKVCPMKFYEHIAVFAAITIIATAVMFVFYHSLVISLIAAVIIAFFLEKSYANGKIRSRRKRLRAQFRDMLESMAVAARAGNSELGALQAALKDLKLTYNEESDIIIEVTNILERYNNGIQLRALFKDFGERSGVEDIISFAQIFEVIEGKSNKFSDIIKQTQQMISDKIEIEQEIETVLTAPKQETAIMLVMPVLLMLMFSSDGDDGMMGMLFTTLEGRLITTACVAVFIGSYFLAQKMTDIKV